MSAQCVSIGTVAGTSQEVLIPDDTCSAGLVVISSEQYAGIANNPLLIPLDVAVPMALATLGLFVAAWTSRESRKALD